MGQIYIYIYRILQIFGTYSANTPYGFGAEKADTVTFFCLPLPLGRVRRDTQVAADMNLGALRKSLPANGKTTIREYDGLNHLFQHCTTGSPTEYAQIEETFSPEVLHDIAVWINGL